MGKGKVDATNQQLVAKSSDTLIIELKYLNAVQARNLIKMFDSPV